MFQSEQKWPADGRDNTRVAPNHVEGRDFLLTGDGGFPIRNNLAAQLQEVDCEPEIRTRVRLLIADDHSMVRKGLGVFLSWIRKSRSWVKRQMERRLSSSRTR